MLEAENVGSVCDFNKRQSLMSWWLGQSISKTPGMWGGIPAFKSSLVKRQKWKVKTIQVPQKWSKRKDNWWTGDSSCVHTSSQRVINEVSPICSEELLWHRLLKKVHADYDGNVSEHTVHRSLLCMGAAKLQTGQSAHPDVCPSPKAATMRM